MVSVVAFNEALSILENSTRREILQFLVKEPHYPLQLSELLNVSQQAIVKHLKVLESAGFVDVKSEKSNKGGPPKKIYVVNQSFSIRLDLGPDLFKAEYRKIPSKGVIKGINQLPRDLHSIVGKLSAKRKLPIVDAINMLADLDSALEEVDMKRDTIISLHQQVMHKVSPSVNEHSELYEERQLAHALMSHPRRPLDLDEFSRGFSIQSSHAEQMMESLREQLMKDLSVTKGAFVSSNSKVPLPWWMAKK